MTTQPYPEQQERAWLASDGEGNLGAFITAGVGPIPTEALNATAVLFDDIEFRILQLPCVSQAYLPVPVPKSCVESAKHGNPNAYKIPDSYAELAERGLFVYDWRDVHYLMSLDAYELVVVPSKPITMSSLPFDLATFAKKVKMTNVKFGESDTVDIRAHLICSESELG